MKLARGEKMVRSLPRSFISLSWLLTMESRNSSSEIFSSLAFGDADTQRFVEDVLREVAALTTGPYLHVGGDEAKATNALDYKAFLKIVGGVMRQLGKSPVAWCEAGEAGLPPGTVLQDWHVGCPSEAGVNNGMLVVASPAARAYLDMKYDQSSPHGTHWAGFVEVQAAYECRGARCPYDRIRPYCRWS